MLKKQGRFFNKLILIYAAPHIRRISDRAYRFDGKRGLFFLQKAPAKFLSLCVPLTCGDVAL